MRREADVCSDFVQECLTNKHGTIIKEAFELCLPQETLETRSNPRQITKQEQRRMEDCLLVVVLERNGKFTSEKQRNKVRFNYASEN